MSAISYRDVFEIEEEVAGEDIGAGDTVRTGPNLYPHFTVVAVDGEMVWIRNIQSGLDALMPLRRCRKVPA